MSTTESDREGGRILLSKAGDRQRQVAASLHVANPVTTGGSGIDVLNGSDYAIDVDVMEVRPYEHNPRQAANPQYEEIKASIARIGLRSPLCVTRRPGESHYIIEAGGNSRLLALQSLYQESANPAFRHVRALYRPWKSESHVLTAHLIENDTRGELLYWDRARALMRLRQQLEAEEHRALSLGDFQVALSRRGYTVSKAALGFYAFAVERLSALGDRCTLLTSDAVKCLQQGVNRLRRYAEDEHAIDEQTFYTDVLEAALQRAREALREARRIDPETLLDQCVGDLAHLVCRPVVQVRAAVFGDGFETASGGRAVQASPSFEAVSLNEASGWRLPIQFLDPIQTFAQAAGVALRDQTDAGQTGRRFVFPVWADDASIATRTSDGMSVRALSLLLEHCAARVGQTRTRHGPEVDLLDWLLNPAEPAAHEFLKALQVMREVSFETVTTGAEDARAKP